MGYYLSYGVQLDEWSSLSGGQISNHYGTRAKREQWVITTTKQVEAGVVERSQENRKSVLERVGNESKLVTASLSLSSKKQSRGASTSTLCTLY